MIPKIAQEKLAEYVDVFVKLAIFLFKKQKAL